MKIKLLSFFSLMTTIVFSQQIYYTVPGPNSNNGALNDIVADNQTLYLAVSSYSNSGSFPVRSGLLTLDTSQSTASASEVSINSSPTAVTLSKATNAIRFAGVSGSDNDFYDIDLAQTLPATSTIVNNITLFGIQAHTFYQGNFIYASKTGSNANLNLEIYLPLQTLTTTTTVWDMEVFGNTLYYIGGDNDNLYSVDLTSASAIPQIIHTDTDNLVALEVTQNYIYYGTFQGKHIKRLDLATNTATIITSLPIPASGNPNFNHARAIEIIGNQVFYGPQSGNLYVLTDNLLSNNNFENVKVKLHPNPTTSILNIESPQKIKTIQIFSVLGKQIKKISQSSLIDVSDLENGIYFAKITSQNGSVTKRFIKK